MRASAAALAGALGLTMLAAPAGAADAIVTTAGLQFVPQAVTVSQGDGLAHVNADAFDHNVTSEDGLFAGATIGTGGNAQVEGVEALPPGDYGFFCTIHPYEMQGTLTVTAAPGLVEEVVLAPVPGVFELPVAMAQHPDSDDLYIVEKTGTIRAVRDGLVYDPMPVLDLSDEVSGGLEQGLLGLAFAPDGEHLYVNFTDTAGHTRVVEFAFVDGAANLDSRRELLVVEQPFSNHNAGTLKFGPDGYLYIALGDGGSANDPEYHGQDTTTLLGSMLRIDPRPSDDGTPYAIPEANPFVPDPEDPDRFMPDEGTRQEIWAYGLRNPWKFSFDRATGDLWIADVGQNRWEEINLQRADSSGGENYGWNHMEGFELLAVRPEGAEEPDNHVPPIHVYPIFGEVSCAVTGGYVYRGEAIGWLQGAYVFSDWCDGVLRTIREEDGEVVDEVDLAMIVPSVTSFGEDHHGELYAISLGGVVLKLLPASP